MSDAIQVVAGTLQGILSSTVFILVLFMGFCIIVGLTKTKRTAGNVAVIKSLDETIKVLRSKYSFSTLNDDNIAKQSLQMARESWLGDEGPDKLLVTNEERWAAGYKELADAGMVPGGADPKPWFDNSFLPNA